MTSLGIDLADLGITPSSIAVKPAAEEIPSPPDYRNLVVGSVLAKSLYSVLNGQPVIIVDSPPGAGKTTLVADIVSSLFERTEMKIIIACPTRRAASDISARIAQKLGVAKDGQPYVVLGVKGMDTPADVGTKTYATKSVTVRTVASCRMGAPVCDLMIIDEAYQTTFHDVSAAADEANQLLMVGDPGQIGPVVTTDVSAFRGHTTAPHMRAPEVFANMSCAVTYSLDRTYRVGQETVDAIAPLYDFSFTSARPERYLTDEDGERVSEIVPFEVPVPDSFDSLDTLVKVATYAADLIGVELVIHNADGTTFTRELLPSDIAIVVAHNAQSSGLIAILRSMGIEGITVGTADKMQGGQWHAVVALDPCTGYAVAGSHQLSPGRLCVMASRHMTHLTWVFDARWEEALMNPDVDPKEAALGLKVRRKLTR